MSAFSRNYGMCILFIIIGAVLGGILGELMKGMDIFSGLCHISLPAILCWILLRLQ